MATGAPKVENLALLTVCVMLATIMQALDTTIANVALPYMQGSLSATVDQINWVLTSYIVAAAIATPVTGFLEARLGRKRLFQIAVAGFTAASVLCGLAGTLPEMVLFRLVQGLFGASLVPLSQAVLLDSYPKEKHGSAMAMWGMGVMVGPILGPTLGGWLTEAYNWRWVFYINVPFGVLSAVGTIAFLSETPLRKSRFDFFGFTTLSLAIGAFQLMLDRGQLKDWFNSTEICITAAIAAMSLYLFIVHMLTTKETPFVSAALFKDRNFVASNVFIFMIGVVLFGTMALVTPFMQNLLGYPIQTAGFLLGSRGVGTLLTMMAAPRLMRMLETRYLILLGLLLTGGTLYYMTGFSLDVTQETINDSFGVSWTFGRLPEGRPPWVRYAASTQLTPCRSSQGSPCETLRRQSTRVSGSISRDTSGPGVPATPQRQGAPRAASARFAWPRSAGSAGGWTTQCPEPPAGTSPMITS